MPTVGERNVQARAAGSGAAIRPIFQVTLLGKPHRTVRPVVRLQRAGRKTRRPSLDQNYGLL